MFPITLINIFSKSILTSLGDGNEAVGNLAYQYCIYNIFDLFLNGINTGFMSFLNG